MANSISGGWTLDLSYRPVSRLFRCLRACCSVLTSANCLLMKYLHMDGSRSVCKEKVAAEWRRW